MSKTSARNLNAFLIVRILRGREVKCNTQSRIFIAGAPVLKGFKTKNKHYFSSHSLKVHFRTATPLLPKMQFKGRNKNVLRDIQKIN